MSQKAKVVLISGGSRGLGKGIIEHLLKTSNHKIVTFSRKKSSFVDRIKKKYKSRFYFDEVDISKTAQIKSFMKDIQKKFKNVDVLINNAGIAQDGVLPVFSDDQIEKVLNINLKGTIVLTREATRLMIKRSHGCILNISSIIGIRGYAGLSVYSSTKAGMIGLTQSLARELGRRKIRVNAIAPGYLETEMSSELSGAQKGQIIRRTPLGRLGTTSDIVALVDFLIDEGSSFITGQTFVVDGGITC